MAEAHYKKALEIKPDYAQAHANYALLHFRRGKIEKALDHAAKAIRLGTLPDKGLRIPLLFQEQMEELGKILSETGQPPFRKGVALAFCLLNGEEPKLEEETDAEALTVCKEILEIIIAAVEDSRPPSDDSTEP